VSNEKSFEDPKYQTNFSSVAKTGVRTLQSLPDVVTAEVESKNKKIPSDGSEKKHPMNKGRT
jgi:hypothetical protein